MIRTSWYYDSRRCPTPFNAIDSIATTYARANKKTQDLQRSDAEPYPQKKSEWSVDFSFLVMGDDFVFLLLYTQQHTPTSVVPR